MVIINYGLTIFVITILKYFIKLFKEYVHIIVTYTIYTMNTLQNIKTRNANANTNVKVLDYKNACMQIKEESKIEIKKETKQEPSYQVEVGKALVILSNRWEKYKKDYINLYGEDTYTKMYEIPNYWVMPEDDEDEEEDMNPSQSETDSYYDEDDYHSDYYY